MNNETTIKLKSVLNDNVYLVCYHNHTHTHTIKLNNVYLVLVTEVPEGRRRSEGRSDIWSLLQKLVNTFQKANQKVPEGRRCSGHQRRVQNADEAQ